MKEKMIFGLLALFLVVLAGAPALYAVEEFAEVYSEDDTEASDPSAFEGDSDNMPGERAPENMPMDDAPVDGAVGVVV
ncbi:MAG: hypothetical protein WCJ71_06520 [Candidatus Omnitrophota bacterium]